MTRVTCLILLMFLAADVAASQAEPIPMQFYEIRVAERRNNSDERFRDWILFRKRNDGECFATPFGNAETRMVASLCGAELDIEGLNVAEVISITHEEFCIRSVEIGALPIFAGEPYLVACEYTRASINQIRINAGLAPVHIP